MSRSVRTSAAGAAFRFALALPVFCAAVPVMAYADDAPTCAAPAEAISLEHAPIRLRERIAQGLPIKIVAIGSSSTFGSGASTPAASYPSRLEAELKAQLPGLPVTVLNKKGQPVTGLTRDSFLVFEDKRPIQFDFLGESAEIEKQPIFIGVLMDTSSSTAAKLGFEKEAAKNFLYTVTRTRKDQAAFVTFDDDVTLRQDFTKNLTT